MQRAVVITGGTDGIGAAVARALFTRGDRAVVLGTDPAKGERLVREAAQTPGEAVFVAADLSLVSDLVRDAENHGGAGSGFLACPPRGNLRVVSGRFRSTRRSCRSTVVISGEVRRLEGALRWHRRL